MQHADQGPATPVSASRLRVDGMLRLQEMDLLSALKTYAVICTAVDYQLLLYDPNVDGKARLFLSGQA
jgi:hypothetical protein